MTRTIKTSRQDIYIRLVDNAESDRDANKESDEEPEDTADGAYLFDYQYELFSLGALIGLARDEQVDPSAAFSQDIRRVGEIDSDNEHRQTIELVNKLVQIDAETDSTEDVWDDVLLYADAGVEYLNDEIDVQDDFDLVRFVREHGYDTWKSRFEELVGSPGEVSTLYK
jgi:antitoxin component HigA of HigAB toxin-antitoxin module